MKELSIPSEHLEKFSFFINLPDELKEEIFSILKEVPIGTSPEVLLKNASESIKNLSKERVRDILEVFFNLTKAKESIELEIDEFLIVLSDSLRKSGIEDLAPTENVLLSFKKLLSNNSNASITSKVIDTMSENQKTYLNSAVLQDIRTVFDNNNNYLASVIVNNLKISYKENEEQKETFIALDNNDIEDLINKLKKAQERVKIIKENINGKTIIEIK